MTTLKQEPFGGNGTVFFCKMDDLKALTSTGEKKGVFRDPLITA